MSLFKVSSFFSTIFLLYVFLFPFNLHSEEEANNYCGLNKGEKVKLIKKNEEKSYVMYVFIDVNLCVGCGVSISNIEKNFKNKDIKIYIILEGIGEEESQTFKKENEWQSDVIADESGLISSYYKIKKKNTILVFKSDGTLIEYGEFDKKTHQKIKQLFENNSKNKKIPFKQSNLLTEIKRVNVLKSDKNVISNGWHIDMLYNSRKNEYYMRNLRKINLFIIDSNGLVKKEINKNNNKNLDGSSANESLSWESQDSILFLFTSMKDFSKCFQFYNVNTDSLTPLTVLTPYFSGKNSRLGYNVKFIHFINKFYTCYSQSYKYPDNLLLSENDTTIFLYDKEGNFTKGFGLPDSVYIKHKVSNWFTELIASDNKNNIITLQQLSNKMKIWDSNLNLIKEYNLDLGQAFRLVNSDLVTVKGRDDIDNQISNTHKLSRTISLLNDNKTNNKLICYFNETFPPEVREVLSKDIIIDKYIVIIDENGKNLYKEPIKVSDGFIPFYFYDNQIQGTEIDDNNHLQIVKYKLNSIN